MSSCVCAKCKKPWEMSSSPAICPVCNQVSFAIAVPEVSAAVKNHYQDPEYRAKISTAVKKRYQDPEYRAKQNAAHSKGHD